MLMLLVGVDYAEAERVLTAAGGELKTAIVMVARGVDAQEARSQLAAASGQLRAVVGDDLLPRANK
jgi:N-acetylmuramic acid 6-phosphate etherase